MNAKVVTDMIPVVSEHILDGQLVIETTCNDFDDFRTLPRVVSYRNITCVRAGWSSDTNRACYKQSHMVAKTVF